MPKFDPRLLAYEEMHAKIQRHYRKMKDIEDDFSCFPALPAHLPTKDLRHRFKRVRRKKRKYDSKATRLIERFRPIVLAKLQFDQEEELLHKNQAFINFSWQRFHELVTWSFPHCIIDAKAMDITPLEDPTAGI